MRLVKSAADKAGLHRVNTTCALELLPICAMRTMAGSGRIRMPVGVMTAGTDLSESRVGPPVAMQCGGSQPNPVSFDLFDNDNGGRKLMRPVMVSWCCKSPGRNHCGLRTFERRRLFGS